MDSYVDAKASDAMMTPDAVLSLISNATTHEGATTSSIENVEETIGRRLPDSYIALMLSSNGLEGFLNDVRYLMLWPMDKLCEYNAGYNVQEWAPELWLFGSNGGDAGYAFDLSCDPMCIKEVPFLATSRDEVVEISSCFDNFVADLKNRV
jgi:hypothetical protein